MGYVDGFVDTVIEQFENERFSGSTYDSRCEVTTVIPHSFTFYFSTHGKNVLGVVTYGCAILISEEMIASNKYSAEDVLHSARVALKSFMSRGITVAEEFPFVSLLKASNGRP